MAGIVWIIVAVVAGLTAAALLATGPTVQVDDRPVSCPGVIAGAEGGVVPEACRAVQARWTWYAAGAGLVSLVAGTGAWFRYPRRAGTSDTLHESIDNR